MYLYVCHAYLDLSPLGCMSCAFGMLGTGTLEYGQPLMLIFEFAWQWVDV